MRILFLILFTPIFSHAALEIAFLEVRGRNGELVQLEPGARFAHVALSCQGGWLHTHPFRGGEVVSRTELEKMGQIAVVVTLPEIDSLSPETVEKFLGKPYDLVFSWDDEKVYCSELAAKAVVSELILKGLSAQPRIVALIQDLEPKAMEFNSDFWPPHYQALRGLPGNSPDDVFRALSKMRPADLTKKKCLGAML